VGGAAAVCGKPPRASCGSPGSRTPPLPRCQHGSSCTHPIIWSGECNQLKNNNARETWLISSSISTLSLVLSFHNPPTSVLAKQWYSAGTSNLGRDLLEKGLPPKKSPWDCSPRAELCRAWTTAKRWRPLPLYCLVLGPVHYRKEGLVGCTDGAWLKYCMLWIWRGRQSGGHPLGHMCQDFYGCD